MAEEKQRQRERPSWWARLVGALALAYPLALLAIVLAFRLVGERWWVTTVALYAPRVPFALPLPVLVVALLVARARRRLLWSQVAAALLLLPLLGICFGYGAAQRPGAARLRVLTYNIAPAAGSERVLAQLRGAAADVAVLEETTAADRAWLRDGLPGYEVRVDGDLSIASRYPVEEVWTPPAPAGFVRYRLRTPAGAIHVYAVHFITPRHGIDELRGDGLRAELRHGRLVRTAAAARVRANAAVRVEQARALADDARRSSLPVVLAGDTNLPPLSWALGHFLGDFTDAFAATATGLGYTFPAPHRPWMRIDRVLAGPGWRVVTCFVSPVKASDHLAVIADLER